MVRVGKKSKKKELLSSTSIEASDTALDSKDELRVRHSSPPALTNGDAESKAESGDLPTDMSASDSDPEESNNDEEAVCTEAHEGKIVMKTVVPFNIDQLFTMTFTNSKFSVELLADRSITDYVEVPWELQGKEKCRQVTYVQGLNSGPIGPKEVHVTETQVMNACSKPGRLYSINCTSENVGVPYADCFLVCVHYCFVRASNTHTDLSIRTHIKYKKSVWPLVRTFIEKNAVGATEDFAKLLEARLTAESDHTVAVRKTRRHRRTAASSSEERTTNTQIYAPRKSISKPPPCSNGWLVAALILLLAINSALLYRVYVERGFTFNSNDIHTRLKLSSFSSGGDSVEWTKALQRQAELHHAEQAAWRAALAQSVALLAQTEQAMVKLMETLEPSMEEAQEAALHTDIWEDTIQERGP